MRLTGLHKINMFKKELLYSVAGISTHGVTSYVRHIKSRPIVGQKFKQFIQHVITQRYPQGYLADIFIG